MDKRSILLVALLLTGASSMALASGTASVYGRHGQFEGTIQTQTDGNSTVYDKNGNEKGTIRSNGDMYDSEGNYQGRLQQEDGQTNIYDRYGNSVGTIQGDDDESDDGAADIPDSSEDGW